MSDGREILEALGVDLDGVVAAKVEFAVGSVPVVTVTRRLYPQLNEQGDWCRPTSIEHYRLVEATP